LNSKFSVFVLACVLSVGILSANIAHAQDKRAQKLNESTVGLMASQAEQMTDALKIADAIDYTDSLRVLPMIGRGGLQSISDLLFLRGVDVAMLSSDSLAYVKKHELYSAEAKKISYLAKLANTNVIVVAKKQFPNLESLEGKRVASGRANSDEFVASDLIFGTFGVNYERVSMSGKAALDGLTDGSIDAAIFVGADSYPLLASVKAESGLRVLSISLNENLEAAYSPAILTNAELPGLISEEAPVETVAAATVLAVFDWPNKSERFFKLKKFNAALFKNYFASLDPEHRTNFSAAVPGWKPYITAKELTGAEIPAAKTQSGNTIQ
jgi:uncharacterized protein